MASGKPLPPYPEMYRLPDLMKMTFPEPMWVIPGVVPQGFSILGGKPKLGKSAMCLGFGLACAFGGRALGKVKVDPIEVLYMAMEDTFPEIQKRVVMLTEEGAYPYGLTVCHEWPRMDQSGLELLGDYLEKNPLCKYVLIDDYSHFRPRTTRARSLYQEDQEISSAIKRVADAYNISITATHHTRKAVADDIVDELNSTLGMTGAIDTTMVLKRARYADEGMLLTTGRKGASNKFALRWDETTISWTLLGEVTDTYVETRERREIIDTLKKAGQSMTARELATLLRKTVPAVKMLTYRMAQVGEIEGVGDGRYMARSVSVPVTGVTAVSSATDRRSSQSELPMPGGVYNIPSSQQRQAPLGPLPAVTASNSSPPGPVTGRSLAYNSSNSRNADNSVTAVTANVQNTGNGTPADTIACLYCGAPVLEASGHMACPACRQAMVDALVAADGQEEHS